MLNKYKIVLSWLKARMVIMPQNDTRFWRVMIASLWIATSIAMIIAGLGNPIGLGLLVDLVSYFVFNMINFSLATILVAVLLSLMYVPGPRLFIGSLIYTGCMVYVILDIANVGFLFSIIIAVVYTIATVFLGLSISIFMSKKIKCHWKTSLGIVLSVFCLFILWGQFWPDSDHATLSEYNHYTEIEPLQVENPAEFGSYPYDYFTYGNGQDRHRPEFGSEVELVSTSVDASHYMAEWEWQRKYFWGFDEKELPLNGRVWMPDGEGPFPLVLMVHGNHRMEYFSDDGYGYLGELLASRGIIAVSIDQNFLNYSSWSRSPRRDMEPRAWMMLQHLLQIKAFQDKPETPFYQRVDLQQVALMGHSRGGQAAAMAADYTPRFDDDPSLDGMDNMTIQAVIALAPTERRVEGRRPVLDDTYYLVLHGAQDGDVNNFYGDRQYGRNTYSAGSDRFSASLYVAEVNHGQFNTDWGRMDMSLPGGLFLNQRNIIAGSAQREIAKVYISAFLKTALHESEQYMDLFRDYRYGQEWLPNTQYVNRFENGMFTPLMNFDRSQEKTSFQNDVTVEAEGFTEWEIEIAQDRRRNNKGMHDLVLEWDDPSAYMVHVSDSFRANMLTSTPESFVFSMANLERDIHIEGEEPIRLPRLDIELESGNKESVLLPLDQFRPVSPTIQTTFSRIALFDDMMREGKYSESMEPVFQLYELPLSAFKQSNPDFKSDDITKITIHFSAGPGKVMLDDIGFMSFSNE